ncbi:transcription elongation factor GreA [Desulfovirgula thermocuniculi]|uniref:transcription elongation factor GreA n=1 Tax=Desulfovirgula thermocuniculi TaxID=348842 RepID=UPI0003FC33D0|nr:transcription elongation factor GreA [Desulfovirgula thermocuniculi]
MKKKEVFLTPEGYKKLERELEELKTVRRREIAERIKQALEFGDISENSEYDEAKREQAFVEGRILTIEKMLRHARLIEGGHGTEEVTLGSTVLLKDLEFGDEVEYTIVGSEEADPGAYKISNESPVGKALMGRRKGDVVEVSAPIGLVRYQILNIR